MKKLKLHLRQYKNTVEMRVLEQEGIDKPLSENVRVVGHPALQNSHIFLRGGDYIRDNDISCITFYTEQEATEYMEKIIEWLDEVFYPGSRKLKRGSVINHPYTKEQAYFVGDLGEDVQFRYVVASNINYDVPSIYTDIKIWEHISKTKNGGYDKDKNEYYGEIE